MSRNINHSFLVLLIFVWFLLMIEANHATDMDWIPFNDGLWGGNVQAIAIDPDNPDVVYIGTIGGGFFYSTNAGSTWTRRNDNLGCWNVLSLLVKKSGTTKIIYAGTTSGLYYLDITNSNNEWKHYPDRSFEEGYISLLKDYQCPKEPEKSEYKEAFYAYNKKCEKNDNSSVGLWILGKEDAIQQINFKDWKPDDVFDLIPYLHKVGDDHNIKKIFVATNIGLFRIYPEGPENGKLNVKRKLTIPTYALAEIPFAENTSKFIIYAGTADGLIYSTNEGNDWEQCEVSENGRIYEKITTLEPSFSNKQVKIYGSTCLSRFFRKYPDEKKWYVVTNTNLYNHKVNALAIKEKNDVDRIFAATELGIFSSTSGGESWSSNNTKNLNALQIHELIHDIHQERNRLYAVTEANIFSRELAHSNEIWQRDEQIAYFTKIAIDTLNHFLYAGTEGQYIYRKKLDEGPWEQYKNGLSNSLNITAIAIDYRSPNNDVYIGTKKSGIFKSSDFGQTWSPFIFEISGLDNVCITNITDIAIDPKQQGRLFISALGDYIYKIDPAGSNEHWDRGKENVYSIACSDLFDSIFAGAEDGVYVCDDVDNFEWKKYTPRLWENMKNVFDIQIIRTVPPFNGVLYDMVTDSENKFTQIHRNIIGKENVESSPKIEFPGNAQIGETFCVNINKPNTIYLGTQGSGAYKFSFQSMQFKIKPEPLEHDFGEVKLREPDEWNEIEIENQHKFMPLIVTQTNEKPIDFEITPQDTIIECGSQQQFTITFTPSRLGDQDTVIAIMFRDIFFYNENFIQNSINVKGFGKYGEFIINDTTIDRIVIPPFYTTHTGMTSHVDISWKHFGNVKLKNFSIEGPTRSDFFSTTEWPDSCDIGSEGNVKLFFHPNTIEHIEDSIVIKYQYDVAGKPVWGNPKTVVLEGEGKEGIFNPVPNPVDFGNVPQSTPKTVILFLKNDGNIPLSIDSIVFEKKDSIFSKDSLLIPLMIEKKDNIPLQLTFRPPEIDSFSNNLIFSYCDSLLPNTKQITDVKLIGNGVLNPLQPTPPDCVDFSDIHIKRLPSQSKFLKLENVCEHLTVMVESLSYNEKKLFRVDKNNVVPCTLQGKDSVFLEIFVENPDEIGICRDTLYIHFHYDNTFGTPDIILKVNVISGIPNINPEKIEVTVPVDTCYTERITIKNDGNIPLYYEILHWPKQPFSLDTLENDIITIPAGSTSYRTISLCPKEIKLHTDYIEIHFWDLENKRGIDSTIKVSLICHGADMEAPIIWDVTHTSPVLKDTFSVKAKIYDIHSGILENSTKLWVRKGGGTGFTALDFTEFNDIDSLFTWVVPEEWVTSRGIEFYIETCDDSEDKNKQQYPSGAEFNYISPPVRIPDGIMQQDSNGLKIPFHTGNAQEDYRLISIPLNTDSTLRSAKNIMTSNLDLYVNPYQWRLAKYLNDKKKYIYLDQGYSFNFDPAKSYFLLIGEDVKDPKYFQSPRGYTFRTDMVFEIPLLKGWNFIANPYNFPIPLNNLKLAHGASMVVLQTYCGSWDDAKNCIYPWEGYIIYSREESDNLQIMPDITKSYFTSLRKEDLEHQKYKWQIVIEASCQNARDNRNIAAINGNALLQYDEFDQPEPPPIGEYVMLGFPHPEWKEPYNFFTVDIQPPDQNGNLWDFTVYTNIPNSDVKLSFQDLRSVPEEFDISLICEHLKYIQDLRQKNLFIYNSTTAQSAQKFRLLIGTSDFVKKNNLDIALLPENFRLDANFPNPFMKTTNVRYDLPQEELVTIYIYNLLGEIVKLIKKEENQSAGKYFVTWDGTNQQGQLVGNGIYFCKFITPKYSKTIKMILIK